MIYLLKSDFSWGQIFFVFKLAKINYLSIIIGVLFFNFFGMDEQVKNSKYVWVACATVIGFLCLLPFVQSNPDLDEETHSEQELQALYTSYQAERSEIEKNIKAMENDILTLQKAMQQEKNRIVALNHRYQEMLSELSTEESVQNHSWSQKMLSRSLSVSNGVLRGVIQSSDEKLLEQYKKNLKKYVTFVSEDEEGFSFVCEKSKYFGDVFAALEE